MRWRGGWILLMRFLSFYGIMGLCIVCQRSVKLPCVFVRGDRVGRKEIGYGYGYRSIS
jgi:hypothetical protein